MKVDFELEYDKIMSKHRNPIAVAMRKRYQNTQTTMKDRRDRRSKDARKSWKKEEW